MKEQEKLRLQNNYAAVTTGDVQTVITLIHQGKLSVNESTPLGNWLHVAARKGQVEVAMELVKAGANVNARGGPLGGNPLNVAASFGHLGVVQHLLSEGSDLDISSAQANPLFGAIQGGHFEIAKVLLESGIDPAVKYSVAEKGEVDAAQFAEGYGQLEILKLLRDDKEGSE